MSFPAHWRPNTLFIKRQTIQNPGLSLYTIHHKPLMGNDTVAHSIFGFSLMNSDETMRSLAVVMKNEEDAMYLARCLQNHKRMTNTWPVAAFINPDTPMLGVGLDNEDRGSSYVPVNYDSDDESQLYIQTWSNDDIQDLCYHHNMDMLIFEFGPTSKQTLEIGLECVEVTPDIDYHRSRFEKLYAQLD